MGWQAYTTYVSIGVGTVLNILETMQVGGQPPNDLPSGCDLLIEFSNNDRTVVKVTEASPDRAIVITSDGQSWEMTPQVSGDPKSVNFNSSMHSKAWVIRKSLIQ